MCSQISARGVTSDEVVFCQEALRACVIAGGKVDLGEPECILVVIYKHQPERESAKEGVLTGESKQFVGDVYCRFVLVFVHGILPPVL